MEPVTLDTAEDTATPETAKAPAVPEEPQAFIPDPKTVHPVKVTIVPNSEYPAELWNQIALTIEAAETEVAKARAVKRLADLAYDRALKQRVNVQVPRDQMMSTDPRTSAEVGRLAGIGRARCAQVRDAMRKRSEGVSA